MNYSNVNKYNKFGFFEFYDILKYHLNEDLWYLIYNLAMPKYKSGDIVLQDNLMYFNNYTYCPPKRYTKIKLVCVYYHNKKNVYLYSYIYYSNILDIKPLNFAICCYALEDKINKIESN